MASFDFISCRKEEVVSQFVCVRQSILLKCSDTVQRTNLLAQMYAPDLTVYRCFESCNQDWFSANKFGSNHDRVKISINPWVFFREEFSQKALPCVYLSSCQKCIDPPWKYLIARSCSVLDFFPRVIARLSYFANLHRIPKIRDTYIASIAVVFFLSFFARHTDYSGL